MKICGDISKHNLARLETNVGHIRTLLKSAGKNVSEPDAHLSVESFYEWYFDYIFVGLTSIIAEFSNNIRWDIYNYTKSEFCRAYTTDGTPNNAVVQMYNYDIPSDFTQPIAQAMYRDLMNRVRSGPWIKPFKVLDFGELTTSVF